MKRKEWISRKTEVVRDFIRWHPYKDTKEKYRSFPARIIRDLYKQKQREICEQEWKRSTPFSVYSKWPFHTPETDRIISEDAADIVREIIRDLDYRSEKDKRNFRTD